MNLALKNRQVVGIYGSSSDYILFCPEKSGPLGQNSLLFFLINLCWYVHLEKFQTKRLLIVNQSSNKKLSRLILTSFVLFLIFSLQNCMTLIHHPQTNVIIKHNLEDLQASSIGIFDFGHSAELKGLGSGFAQFTKDYLLSKKFIRLIELVEKRAGTVDQCIKIGREMGYDLILVGYITEIFYGGISTNSKISISIRIIDVRTKVTLWYAKGYLEGQYEEPADYIFFINGSKAAPFPSELGGLLVKELLNEIKSVGQVQHRKDRANRLESFLRMYCQTYENKDLDKFVTFFTPDAIENNRSFHELLPKYSRNMEMVKLFNYRIELADYYLLANSEKVMVQGKFFIRYLLHGGTWKENSGSVSMELIESDGSYLIKKLSYGY